MAGLGDMLSQLFGGSKDPSIPTNLSGQKVLMGAPAVGANSVLDGLMQVLQMGMHPQQQSFNGQPVLGGMAMPWAGKTSVNPDELENLINSRSSLYHSTRAGNLIDILDSNELKPGNYGGYQESGVSTSRVPTIVPKGGARGPDVLLRLDPSKVGPTVPVAESGWGKLKDTGGNWWNFLNNDELNQYNMIEAKNKPEIQKWVNEGGPKPAAVYAQEKIVGIAKDRAAGGFRPNNEEFEFEQRTKGTPIRLTSDPSGGPSGTGALQKVILNKTLADETSGKPYEELINTLKDRGIPYEVKSHAEMNLDRLNKDKLKELFGERSLSLAPGVENHPIVNWLMRLMPK